MLHQSLDYLLLLLPGVLLTQGHRSHETPDNAHPKNTAANESAHHQPPPLTKPLIDSFLNPAACASVPAAQPDTTARGRVNQTVMAPIAAALVTAGRYVPAIATRYPADDGNGASQTQAVFSVIDSNAEKVLARSPDAAHVNQRHKQGTRSRRHAGRWLGPTAPTAAVAKRFQHQRRCHYVGTQPGNASLAQQERSHTAKQLTASPHERPAAGKNASKPA